MIMDRFESRIGAQAVQLRVDFCEAHKCCALFVCFFECLEHLIALPETSFVGLIGLLGTKAPIKWAVPYYGGYLVLLRMLLDIGPSTP